MFVDASSCALRIVSPGDHSSTSSSDSEGIITPAYSSFTSDDATSSSSSSSPSPLESEPDTEEECFAEEEGILTLLYAVTV